jgi:glycosyltransferase involved in cell wall biosynthesis
MRIAFVNIFRPRGGSGDGITEYTYQLYEKLKDRHKIDFFFALEESKRVDIPGRLYTELYFRFILKKLAYGNYDAIHITNPEIGYVAKNIKKYGIKSKVILTIHDFVRVAYLYRKTGGLQNVYDYLVKKNTEDAIKYSDSIIFTSTREMKYGKEHYKINSYSWIPIGAKDLFLKKPIPKQSKKGKFTIGYIGGLIKSRNVDFILKTAENLNADYVFRIYGIGAELDELLKYKKEKNLQNVEFMGFAPEKEILKIYDSLDVFMSCSEVDVASLPIEDALARGIPVLSAKKNLYDEELRKRVYEAENPKEAARQIKRFKEKGYPRKKRDAILKYAKSLSWENVAKKTEIVYKN